MTADPVKTDCPQPHPLTNAMLHHDLVRRSARLWNQTGEETPVAQSWVQAGGPVKTANRLNEGPWWLSWWAFAELEYRALLVNSVPRRDYYSDFYGEVPAVKEVAA